MSGGINVPFPYHENVWQNDQARFRRNVLQKTTHDFQTAKRHFFEVALKKHFHFKETKNMELVYGAIIYLLHMSTLQKNLPLVNILTISGMMRREMTSFRAVPLTPNGDGDVELRLYVILHCLHFMIVFI